MVKRYISFKIEGLDNCILQNLNINGIDSHMFESASMNQGKDACTVTFYINNDSYNTESFEKEYDKIVVEAREVVKYIIGNLIMDGFDIVGYHISEPSVCILNGKHFEVSGSITIKEVENGIVTKEYLKDGFDFTSQEMNEDLKNIIDILSVSDEIVRYEFLFEKLKQKCGNSQVKVIEKIRDDYPQMYTKNHNIDTVFWKTKQEWQDDFSYLRTLISHGKAEHYEEISERLERDTNRIVKILYDLCK